MFCLMEGRKWRYFRARLLAFFVCYLMTSSDRYENVFDLYSISSKIKLSSKEFEENYVNFRKLIWLLRQKFKLIGQIVSQSSRKLIRNLKTSLVQVLSKKKSTIFLLHKTPIYGQKREWSGKQHSWQVFLDRLWIYYLLWAIRTAYEIAKSQLLS